MSTHDALVEWTLRPGDDFLAGHYSRAHAIAFDAGVTLPGSASPSVVHAPWSEEAAADPEELLVAAISTCHMLWFLDFARRAGVAVSSYRDTPSARMGRMASGRIGLVTCTLRPDIHAITADGSPPTASTLAELHHKAHDACNIANSVLTDVRVEPVPPEPVGAALQGDPAHA